LAKTSSTAIRILATIISIGLVAMGAFYMITYAATIAASTPTTAAITPSPTSQQIKSDTAAHNSNNNTRTSSYSLANYQNII
jgi:hypothetical protein